MATTTQAVLDELVESANLAAVVDVAPVIGRGFDNEVLVATLADGQKVVLRRAKGHRPLEATRAHFLSSHGVPAPRLLASSTEATLHAFAPGTLLGDLIERGRATDATWRSVGVAFRRVHATKFPPRLFGRVLPDEIVLAPCDPVRVLKGQIDDARPWLQATLPDLTSYLDDLHEIVEAARIPLERANTALGHGDINLWNIVVGPRRTVLVDWDSPRVVDPAMEVALLDKHASFFNGEGIPVSFFKGYGRPAPEPNTSIHRVIQSLSFAASPAWSKWLADPELPADLKERTAGWRATLLDYLERLPAHVLRLRMLISKP